jgi:carboxylesterase
MMGSIGLNTARGHMPVMPGAQPFAADGGRIGVVVAHGFTGTPQSMLPWAQALAGAGFTVRLPLLPGHGTRWQDMNNTRWTDWYATIESTFSELRSTCDHVFAAGLSMGGTLVLRLAEQMGERIDGVITVNPSLGTERKDAKLLPAISRVIPSLAGIAGDIKKPGVTELGYNRIPLRAAASLSRLWAITSADLPDVVCPVLTFRSRVDHVVEALSGRLLRSAVVDVREIVLENSYHVATLDNDAPLIFAKSIDFIREHSDEAVRPQVPA